MIKNGKNKNNKGKCVEIFKDDISLGIFKSAMSLEQESEKLFGIKIWNSSISLVCNGIKEIYKGYTFKHVE